MDGSLTLNEHEYLSMRGLDVMLAHDYYPESHQGGVGIIQNGLRVATNGDLRLEASPGQWAPVPKVGPRVVDRETGEISVRMSYPDAAKNRRGFNPIDYPDLHLSYTLSVRPEGASFRIKALLHEDLPPEWKRRVSLNLELFPGDLFGKSFRLDDAFGIFPRQAVGPCHDAGPALSGTPSEGDAPRIVTHHRTDGGPIMDVMPLARGRKLTVAPESDRQRLTIEVVGGGPLELLDGRGRHNNGWFVVRSLVDGLSVEWLVTPHPIPGWVSGPVVQVSQVGYHPSQPKVAVIELDRNDDRRLDAVLLRAEADGYREVRRAQPATWGRFLRYEYLQFDFSDVQEPGMYAVEYVGFRTSPFSIDRNVFARGVWQPTVETFLPVQMCHMRVVDRYRVWHGLCHIDDALMAPTDHNHFDGYVQGPSTLCPVKPGERVPGLDVGGWHDAGDYDLRVESQADTVHELALAYELFGLDYDNTTVDQAARRVELMRPDGVPDVLQQVEHGVRTILGGYRSLGRLYRGIIEPTLEQYTHLGDAATQTDNLPSSDDRWVFTEDNPRRELSVAAALAAASRVLPGELGRECFSVALRLWEVTQAKDPLWKLELAVELLACGRSDAHEFILEHAHLISEQAKRVGWLGARASMLLRESEFSEELRPALEALRKDVEELEEKTPYGLPYEPDIWGAGWGIQSMGVRLYWLHRAFPDLFPARYVFSALNFVLGCHPGQNPASFVSGVGARSLIPGYGVNRADESYIPGGIGSGTALIRPDYPELLVWPYLWQQAEYCVGHPTSEYVFLVTAIHDLLENAHA